MRQRLRSHDFPSGKPCADLVQWLRARSDLRTIAVYSPLPGEVDLSTALCLLPDRTWVYPKVDGHDLTFHQAETWVTGEFGIREPADGSPEVAVRDIDAFICPGLAFDRNGGRLGRGRGFYDRMLANATPDALKIGVCFEFQIVPETFSEPHDIHMDAVVY